MILSLLHLDFKFYFGKFGVLFTDNEKKKSNFVIISVKMELVGLLTQIPLSFLTQCMTENAKQNHT